MDIGVRAPIVERRLNLRRKQIRRLITIGNLVDKNDGGGAAVVPVHGGSGRPLRTFEYIIRHRGLSSQLTRMGKLTARAISGERVMQFLDQEELKNGKANCRSLGIPSY